MTGSGGVAGTDDWSKAGAMTKSGEFLHVFVAVYNEIVGVYSRSERGERSRWS